MKTVIRHIKNGKAQKTQSAAKKANGHVGQFSIHIAFLPEAFLMKTAKGTKVVPNPEALQFLQIP